MIFNDDRYDTLKVKNVYEPQEETKGHSKDTAGDAASVNEDRENPANNTSEQTLLTYTMYEFISKLGDLSIVEALFILFKLMFGSKKVQVQEKLHKLGIISIVCKLYCLLVKTTECEHNPLVMVSIPICYDMKIQILKVVINYLSRNTENLSYKLE